MKILVYIKTDSNPVSQAVSVESTVLISSFLYPVWAFTVEMSKCVLHLNMPRHPFGFFVQSQMMLFINNWENVNRWEKQIRTPNSIRTIVNTFINYEDSNWKMCHLIGRYECGFYYNHSGNEILDISTTFSSQSKLNVLRISERITEAFSYT